MPPKRPGVAPKKASSSQSIPRSIPELEAVSRAFIDGGCTLPLGKKSSKLSDQITLEGQKASKTLEEFTKLPECVPALITHLATVELSQDTRELTCNLLIRYLMKFWTSLQKSNMLSKTKSDADSCRDYIITILHQANGPLPFLLNVAALAAKIASSDLPKKRFPQLLSWLVGALGSPNQTHVHLALEIIRVISPIKPLLGDSKGGIINGVCNLFSSPTLTFIRADSQIPLDALDDFEKESPYLVLLLATFNAMVALLANLTDYDKKCILKLSNTLISIVNRAIVENHIGVFKMMTETIELFTCDVFAPYSNPVIIPYLFAILQPNSTVTFNNTTVVVTDFHKYELNNQLIAVFNSPDFNPPKRQIITNSLITTQTVNKVTTPTENPTSQLIEAQDDLPGSITLISCVFDHIQRYLESINDYAALIRLYGFERNEFSPETFQEPDRIEYPPNSLIKLSEGLVYSGLADDLGAFLIQFIFTKLNKVNDCVEKGQIISSCDMLHLLASVNLLFENEDLSTAIRTDYLDPAVITNIPVNDPSPGKKPLFLDFLFNFIVTNLNNNNTLTNNLQIKKLFFALLCHALSDGSEQLFRQDRLVHYFDEIVHILTRELNDNIIVPNIVPNNINNESDASDESDESNHHETIFHLISCVARFPQNTIVKQTFLDPITIDTIVKSATIIFNNNTGILTLQTLSRLFSLASILEGDFAPYFNPLLPLFMTGMNAPINKDNFDDALKQQLFLCTFLKCSVKVGLKQLTTENLNHIIEVAHKILKETQTLLKPRDNKWFTIRSNVVNFSIITPLLNEIVKNTLNDVTAGNANPHYTLLLDIVLICRDVISTYDLVDDSNNHFGGVDDEEEQEEEKEEDNDEMDVNDDDIDGDSEFYSQGKRHSGADHHQFNAPGENLKAKRWAFRTLATIVHDFGPNLHSMVLTDLNKSLYEIIFPIEGSFLLDFTYFPEEMAPEAFLLIQNLIEFVCVPHLNKLKIAWDLSLMEQVKNGTLSAESAKFTADNLLQGLGRFDLQLLDGIGANDIRQTQHFHHRILTDLQSLIASLIQNISFIEEESVLCDAACALLVSLQSLPHGFGLHEVLVQEMLSRIFALHSRISILNQNKTPGDDISAIASDQVLYTDAINLTIPLLNQIQWQIESGVFIHPNENVVHHDDQIEFLRNNDNMDIDPQQDHYVIVSNGGFDVRDPFQLALKTFAQIAKDSTSDPGFPEWYLQHYFGMISDMFEKVPEKYLFFLVKEFSKSFLFFLKNGMPPHNIACIILFLFQRLREIVERIKNNDNTNLVAENVNNNGPNVDPNEMFPLLDNAQVEKISTYISTEIKLPQIFSTLIQLIDENDYDASFEKAENDNIVCAALSIVHFQTSKQVNGTTMTDATGTDFKIDLDKQLPRILQHFPASSEDYDATRYLFWLLYQIYLLHPENSTLKSMIPKFIAQIGMIIGYDWVSLEGPTSTETNNNNQHSLTEDEYIAIGKDFIQKFPQCLDEAKKYLIDNNHSAIDLATIFQ